MIVNSFLVKKCIRSVFTNDKWSNSERGVLDGFPPPNFEGLRSFVASACKVPIKRAISGWEEIDEGRPLSGRMEKVTFMTLYKSGPCLLQVSYSEVRKEKDRETPEQGLCILSKHHADCPAKIGDFKIIILFSYLVCLFYVLLRL